MMHTCLIVVGVVHAMINSYRIKFQHLYINELDPTLSVVEKRKEKERTCVVDTFLIPLKKYNQFNKNKFIPRIYLANRIKEILLQMISIISRLLNLLLTKFGHVEFVDPEAVVREPEALAIVGLNDNIMIREWA